MTRLLTALLAILALGLSGQAAATKRVALVIGNAEYAQVGSLDNPAKDARAMGAVLRDVGFDVVQGIDLDRSGMQDALKVFSEKLNSAEVALFYYAGHGIQVDGENYLIPVDAQIENETDLAFATVPLGLIEEEMSEVPRVKLIMLDACRDNPFKTDLMRNLTASRSITVSDGLAPVSLADDVGGTFIAFATDPGAYASDGIGMDHAPFTQALLDNMSRPGMEIHEMMIDVRAQVWVQTEQAQRPWSNSSLTGKFYFSDPVRTEKAPATTTPKRDEALVSVGRADLDLAFWQSISESGSEAEYQAYLNQFPDGVFAEIARARITAGAAEQIAQAIAPPASTLTRQGTVSSSTTRQEPTQQAENYQTRFGSLDLTASGSPRIGDVRRNRDVRPLGTPKVNEPSQRVPQTPFGHEDAMQLSEDERIAIERYLSALGIDPGRTDGVFDEHTRAAIRAWQWAEELPPTGYLTFRQIDLMRTHALTTAQNAATPSPASYNKSSTPSDKATWPSLEVFADDATPRRASKRVVFSTEQSDENLFETAIREISDNIFVGTQRPLNPEIEALRRQEWQPGPKDR
ncbi:MAG: caspase family protein [Pseudomonadota bacterium]